MLVLRFKINATDASRAAIPANHGQTRGLSSAGVATICGTCFVSCVFGFASNSNGSGKLVFSAGASAFHSGNIGPGLTLEYSPVRNAARFSLHHSLINSIRTTLIFPTSSGENTSGTVSAHFFNSSLNSGARRIVERTITHAEAELPRMRTSSPSSVFAKKSALP